MSIELSGISGRNLWLLVELVILAGIITGILLINFDSGPQTISRTIGYSCVALGIFSLIGIEIYLAIRSRRP